MEQRTNTHTLSNLLNPSQSTPSEMTQPTEKVALTLFYNSLFQKAKKQNKTKQVVIKNVELVSLRVTIIENGRRREMYKVQNLPDACEAVGDVQADL